MESGGKKKTKDVWAKVLGQQWLKQVSMQHVETPT